MKRERRTWAAIAALACAGLLLSACQGTAAEEPVASVSGDPVIVENCGAELTFDSVPERIVVLKSAPIAALHELQLLDRVVARAGQFPKDYYDAATLTELQPIPELASDVDATGHLQISQEIVIAQRPDLVLGAVENLDQASLARLGIPLIEEPELCPAHGDRAPDFDSVYEQIRLYGAVFDRRDRAEEVVTELTERVRTAQERVRESEGRSAAMLYPTSAGGPMYAYGASSMADSQLEAAGLTNVFADVDDRVFEVSAEQLLRHDPDVIILLYSAGDPAVITEALERLPGGNELGAVRKGAVMTMLLNFSTPATPLAVDGLERIIERFSQ